MRKDRVMPQGRFWRQIPRRVIILGVLALSVLALSLSVVSTGASVAASPQGKTTPFTLTSPDFTPNGPLSRRAEYNHFGCTGKNIAPRLNWRGVPAGTAGFALVMNDYDAPIAGGFHHWIVYNIPASARSLTGSSGFTQGTNSFGFAGYGGPCPPATGQVHHYIFTLYALTVHHVSGKALTYDQLIHAINGKVAGATVTIGTFVRG